MKPSLSISSAVRGTSRRAWGWLLCALISLCGCGTTKQNIATEQMLNSDAVDASIAKIDFTPLSGQLVYFDTQYMKDYKGIGFVNSQYVISSLRQQMLAAGLLLQADIEAADYVVEGRIGTLGTDSHEVVYGVPSNSALSTAAAAASAASGVPVNASIPELSLGKRDEQVGAAKIGVFAYDRETKQAIWQSGPSVARATAKDVWFLGIGPFQRGTIYKGKVRFAGETLDMPAPGAREGTHGAIADYNDAAVFELPHRKERPLVAKEPSGSDSQATGNKKSVFGTRDTNIQQASGESPQSDAPASSQE